MAAAVKMLAVIVVVAAISSTAQCVSHLGRNSTGATEVGSNNRRLLGGGCSLERGIVYWGHDIGGGCAPEHQVETRQDCCALCQATPNCAAWTWHKPVDEECPKGCFLKDVKGEKRGWPTAVSGKNRLADPMSGSEPAHEGEPDDDAAPDDDEAPDDEPVATPAGENDAWPHGSDAPTDDGNAPTDGGNAPTNIGNAPTDGGDYSGGACPDPDNNLALHNAKRAAHADTAPLAWSPALASSAQAFADTLGANCDWYHSGAEGVGENLFWSVHAECSTAVEGWYSERDMYDFNNPDANVANFAAIGHLTQILWRSTTEVGCGASYCDGGTLVVCHYAEQGNYLDQLGAQVGAPL